MAKKRKRKSVTFSVSFYDGDIAAIDKFLQKLKVNCGITMSKNEFVRKSAMVIVNVINADWASPKAWTGYVFDELFKKEN